MAYSVIFMQQNSAWSWIFLIQLQGENIHVWFHKITLEEHVAWWLKDKQPLIKPTGWIWYLQEPKVMLSHKPIPANLMANLQEGAHISTSILHLAQRWFYITDAVFLGGYRAAGYNLNIPRGVNKVMAEWHLWHKSEKSYPWKIRVTVFCQIYVPA